MEVVTRKTRLNEFRVAKASHLYVGERIRRAGLAANDFVMISRIHKHHLALNTQRVGHIRYGRTLKRGVLGDYGARGAGDARLQVK